MWFGLQMSVFFAAVNVDKLSSLLCTDAPVCVLTAGPPSCSSIWSRVGARRTLRFSHQRPVKRSVSVKLLSWTRRAFRIHELEGGRWCRNAGSCLLLTELQQISPDGPGRAGSSALFLFTLIDCSSVDQHEMFLLVLQLWRIFFFSLPPTMEIILTTSPDADPDRLNIAGPAVCHLDADWLRAPLAATVLLACFSACRSSDLLLGEQRRTLEKPPKTYLCFPPETRKLKCSL